MVALAGPAAEPPDRPGDPVPLPSDPDRRLSSYAYELPEAFIAQSPVEPRHAARMLAVPPPPQARARHLRVWDLQQELKPGDLLVVNDTRVLKARLEVRRASGGRVELLVLEPRPGGGAEGSADWLCLARPARRLRPGEILRLEAPGQPPLDLPVVGVEPESGGRVVRFPADCVSAEAIEGLLARCGTMPLPPYIHGHRDDDDSRYQTRYAARPGAVAAPTAGLHLSDELLEAFRRRGIERATVTLHVGLGTFRPVESEDLTGLQLHSEWVEVSPELVAAVAACRERGGRVIAVGTTCVRSLEAVAGLHGGGLAPHRGPVDLVIQPGYRFHVVQGLLTNFHLPRSSLLLLVSALLGRHRLLDLYEQAKAEGYRFFSYGDAMWIPPEAVLDGARPSIKAGPGADGRTLT